MKLQHISPVYVDIIPEKLQDGMIYISERYGTAIHRCCCGCGEEVVTPLTPADWSLRREGDAVTLHPSIGNWSFACRSHYWIQRNSIVWAGAIPTQEVKLIQARDLAAVKLHAAVNNAHKEEQANSRSPLARLWQAIRRWFRG